MLDKGSQRAAYNKKEKSVQGKNRISGKRRRLFKDSIHSIFFFLLTYIITLFVNVLILCLVIVDSQLHSPMYFFLGNLAFLDMTFSSVTAPRMLSDFINTKRTISFHACLAQIFLLVYLGSSELFLLAAMSYDRYVAICHPLHYIQMMSRKTCIQLGAVVWILGFSYSLIHTLSLFRLTFCGSNIIHNLFCELQHLFQLSCTDPFINYLLILIGGGVFGIGAFIITVIPYVCIFNTVLRIPTSDGKLKVFSTCTPHFIVVFLFYGSVIIIYFIPTISSLIFVNMVLSITYAVINPLLNPLIYSLRNKEILTALRKALKIIQLY
ncbi:olfactory receptor 1G1-like [Rhinophrynus dorsalis]